MAFFRSVAEVDKVNAFGRVVERDFVTAPTMSRSSSAQMIRGVAEVDRVNAYGQVVERDFVGSVPVPFPVSRAASSTVIAPTTYAPRVMSGVAEVDKVNAFGQVVERDFVGGGVQRILSSTPMQSRSVTPLRTVAAPTYAAPTYAAPTTVVAAPTYAPSYEFDKVNAYGQVVERDFIGGSSRFVTGVSTPMAPVYASPLPASRTVVGGVTEVDKVNSFGQVVERDFVGGSSRFISAAPRSISPQPVYRAPLPVARSVTEIDTVNAFGRVVERDFVSGVPFSRGSSAQVLARAPSTTMMVGGVAEVDQVNAFGQVVERDFVSTAPRILSRQPSTQLIGGFTEVDRLNAYGQVVERDFYGAMPVKKAKVIAGGIENLVQVTQPYPYMAEVDTVNMFGQVVERDFVTTVPQVVVPQPAVEYDTVVDTVIGGKVVERDVYQGTSAYASAALEVDKVNSYGQVVERDFVAGVPVSTML